MISFKNLLKNTALLCTMLTAGVTLAEDGVVRMSERKEDVERLARYQAIVDVEAATTDLRNRTEAWAAERRPVAAISAGSSATDCPP